MTAPAGFADRSTTDSSGATPLYDAAGRDPRDFKSAPALTALPNISARCHQNQLDILRGQLRIGIHRDGEVTDTEGGRRPLVSQAFCSALPAAYTRVPASHWEAFASLVLEAAYEGTISAALLNAKRGASNVVLLTQLGGGAFGNHDHWIDAAMRRSLEKVRDLDLDVKLVSYGAPSRAIAQITEDFLRK
jgi:hypothetical protein